MGDKSVFVKISVLAPSHQNPTAMTAAMFDFSVVLRRVALIAVLEAQRKGNLPMQKPAAIGNIPA